MGCDRVTGAAENAYNSVEQKAIKAINESAQNIIDNKNAGITNQTLAKNDAEVVEKDEPEEEFPLDILASTTNSASTFNLGPNSESMNLKVELDSQNSLSPPLLGNNQGQ